MEIVLETPRLILRRFKLSDEDSANVLFLNSFEEVLQYLHEPRLSSMEAATQILQEQIIPQYLNDLGRLAIHTKHDKRFIGWCGLKYRADLDETDLGYRLVPDVWGNGFASEAAKAILDYGLLELGISEIIGRAHINNLASIRILQKIGMHESGEAFIDGCPVRVFKKQNPQVSQ